MALPVLLLLEPHKTRRGMLGSVPTAGEQTSANTAMWRKIQTLLEYLHIHRKLLHFIPLQAPHVSVEDASGLRGLN